MNAKRKATLLGAAGAVLLYLALLLLPALGGQITAEQPVIATAKDTTP